MPEHVPPHPTPRGTPPPVRPAVPLLLALLSLAACGPADDPEPGPPAADATRVDEPLAALPEGAEARSLTGDPLYPPELDAETRAEYEANLAEAEADLEADPESADALIWYGRRLAYLGRYREAIDVYTRGIALHPDDPRFYRHRGHRWITVRELDRAVEDLRRATELIEGTEDRVEPDGLPNERGIPTSTLHFNIWYHLGLAHYLKGEFEQALLAYEACLDASKHPDSVVATSYWLNNTARRLGLEERADEVVGGVEAGMDIIESTAYLDVLLLWKGERTREEVLPEGPAASLESVTTAYGVGLWHFLRGDEDDALRIWEDVLARDGQWAAFGFIAAEAELARRGPEGEGTGG